MTALQKDMSLAFDSFSNYMSSVIESLDRKATAIKHKYKEDMDYFVIESSRLTPSTVIKGNSFENSLTLVLLSPERDKTFHISISRTIRHSIDEIDLGAKNEILSQGTSHIISKFTLPKDVEIGQYSLETYIEISDTNNLSDKTVNYFLVSSPE